MGYESTGSGRRRRDSAHRPNGELSQGKERDMLFMFKISVSNANPSFPASRP